MSKLPIDQCLFQEYKLYREKAAKCEERKLAAEREKAANGAKKRKALKSKALKKLTKAERAALGL